MRTIPFPTTAIALVTFVLAASSGSAATPAPQLEFPAPSPSATLKQRVGLTDIEINYSRPGVKGRKIFGGLEPWGEVWRAGANTATRITFSTPVKLNGHEVAAGTYGLFALLGERSWTIILNNVPNQWGAYAYDQKNDALRVTATPVKLAEPVETFTIDLNDIRDESATLNLMWENTRVPVKLEVDVVSTLVPQIEAVMASDAEKKPYFAAAMFYLDHNLDLKKAAEWMDVVIAAQPDAFYLTYRKAKILAKMGDKEGVLAAANDSLARASKASGAIKDEYTRLNQELIASLK